MGRTKRRIVEDLDFEIARLQGVIKTQEPDTEEYKKVRQEIDGLCEIRNKYNSNRVSKDAILSNFVYFGTTALVLGYEWGHVLKGKVTTFLLKGRLTR